MANPTPEQVVTLQQTMADVEVAYQQTLRARQAIVTLTKLGQLKCRDVQNYNLQMAATWAYQETAGRLIKAAGGQAPDVPTPVYVAWKGVPGDQAADIDCATSSMAGSGWWRRFSVKSLPVRGADIEWRSGPSVKDQTLVAKAVASGVKKLPRLPNGQLGALPAVAVFAVKIVLVGILIAVVAWAVTSILDAFYDGPGKRAAAKIVAIQATQNTAVMEKRTACYNDCAGRGRDPAACAATCGEAYPGFKPVIPSTGLGIVGTVAGVAVVGLVGYGTWKFLGSRAWGRSSSGRRLPMSRQLDEGVIDV